MLNLKTGAKMASPKDYNNFDIACEIAQVLTKKEIERYLNKNPDCIVDVFVCELCKKYWLPCKGCPYYKFRDKRKDLCGCSVYAGLNNRAVGNQLRYERYCMSYLMAD